MQVTHLTPSQAAEVLADAKTLTILEWAGTSTHVLEANGRDVLLVQDVTGAAQLIDDSAHDADSGGSIHDQARAIFGDDTDAA